MAKCPRCGNTDVYFKHGARTGKRGEFVSYYYCGHCGNDFNDEMNDEEYARFKRRCEEDEIARAQARREEKQWEKDVEDMRNRW